MNADMERQRRYEQRFAEIYGKPMDELTSREKQSSAVFDAHRKAVAAILGPPPPPPMRVVREGGMPDRMRRVNRIETVALIVLFIAVVLVAFLRLS